MGCNVFIEMDCEIAIDYVLRRIDTLKSKLETALNSVSYIKSNVKISNDILDKMFEFKNNN